jgi:hypothetical protein
MYGSNFCLGIQRLVSRDYVTPNIGQSSHQPKARVLPDYHPSPRGTMFSYCAMISVTPFPGLAADCATFWLHSALNHVHPASVASDLLATESRKSKIGHALHCRRDSRYTSSREANHVRGKSALGMPDGQLWRIRARTLGADATARSAHGPWIDA